ncbi:uncharacterized protein EV422DRAFT_498634, partial [Fimicolochytrium jonesii]|uniref:uncharacterized protein n=1 Tax=Fimicolochytrium jonesii TaxID=1396493 RepID=UPI0022FDBD66
EEDDMLCCHQCGTWGHLACAGFKSLTDRRLPTTYVCFACLNDNCVANGSKPKFNLEFVAEVALFRRGIAIAWKDGIKSMTDFATDMG